MERRDAYKERIPSRGCSPLLGAILYTLGPSIPYFVSAVLILTGLGALFLPIPGPQTLLNSNESTHPELNTQ
jgi:hypothetical protein